MMRLGPETRGHDSEFSSDLHPASRPETYHHQFTETAFPVGTCPDGSAILEDATVQLAERIFFAKDGIPTRIQFHGHIVDGKVYNAVSGNSLPEVGHFNFTIYPEDGILIQKGLTSRVNLPGSGHVLLDAGRFVMDLSNGDVLWQAGHHQHVNGEVDELCAALDALG